MPNISGIGNVASQAIPQKVVSKKADTSASSASTTSASTESGSEGLSFQSLAHTVAAQPAYDHAKVATIRQALSEGKYPLDSKKMAQSFLAIEQMIGHSGGNS